MNNDEFNKNVSSTLSYGCGCFLAFLGTCIAVFVACWGTPKEQFLPTLAILILFLGGIGFLFGYLFSRFTYTPSDMNNITCPSCGQKYIPINKRPPASPNDGPRCPTCKQLLNPSTSDTTAESSPEKTSPERDA